MEGSSPSPPGRGSHGGILSRGRPPQRRRGALATGTQAAPGLCCRVPLKGTWRAASAFACSCRHAGVEVGGWACRLRPAPERPRGRSRSEWSCPASHSYNWGAWWAASACACAGRHMGLWSRSVELPRGQQAVDHDAWVNAWGLSRGGAMSSASCGGAGGPSAPCGVGGHPGAGQVVTWFYRGTAWHPRSFFVSVGGGWPRTKGHPRVALKSGTWEGPQAV